MRLEESHWWDWACLNITPLTKNPLSRMMWCGHWNVPIFQESVASVVSLGKSSQSIIIPLITSHDQWGEFTIIHIPQWPLFHLNGFQFGQVYSITETIYSHSQTQQEDNCGMYFHQRRVIWEKTSLVITHCEWEYSSTPMKPNKIHPCRFQLLPIQANLCNQSHDKE